MSETRVNKIASRDGSKSIETGFLIDGTAKAWSSIQGLNTAAILKSYVTVSYLKDVERRLTGHLLRIESKLSETSTGGNHATK